MKVCVVQKVNYTTAMNCVRKEVLSIETKVPKFPMMCEFKSKGEYKNSR